MLLSENNDKASHFANKKKKLNIDEHFIYPE